MSPLDPSFARYRFQCRARTPVCFPPYAGSAWRGAFGQALKSSVCVTRQRHCRECLLWRSCAYSYIFETPPPENSEILRKYPAAPHPFIIHPEQTHGMRYEAGQTFSVDLTLIGRANDQLAYIVHAWSRIGERGIGRREGRFELTDVSQHTGDQWRSIHRPGEPLAPLPPQPPPDTPLPAPRCRMALHTPMRIKYHERLMGPGEFSFRGLLASLLRRLSLLRYFHGPGRLELDFSSLLTLAENVVPLEHELAWRDWTRYSSRQKTSMQMGGLTGWLVFDSRDLEPFRPWLQQGRHLHVGKGTVMGLGAYRLEAAE